jgi:hypothetical protein
MDYGKLHNEMSRVERISVGSNLEDIIQMLQQKENKGQ